MTDVEKYGVFALVFVMGVLGLIVFYEPDPGPGAAASSGQSVIIRSAADVPLTAGVSAQRSAGRPAAQGDPAVTLAPTSGRQGGRADAGRRQASSGQPVRYRVVSPADGVGEFEFNEAPLAYPGERSSLGRPDADGLIVHVVRKGETLSKISKTYFGTAERHREILSLNPGLDPRKMRPGDEVIVAGAPRAMAASSPATSAPRAGQGSAAPSGRTYVVKKGDTLGLIAQRTLGTVKRVDELFAANKGVLDNPHDLKIGMELKIP